MRELGTLQGHEITDTLEADARAELAYLVKMAARAEEMLEQLSCEARWSIFNSNERYPIEFGTRIAAEQWLRQMFEARAKAMARMNAEFIPYSGIKVLPANTVATLLERYATEDEKGSAT